MRDADQVVIVGGGFSGVALATELARRRLSVRVTLVESGPEIGRGVAYGTRLAAHLLNTRARQMSVRADDPEHFVRWIRRRGFAAHGPEFVPRREYGRYLAEALSEVYAGDTPTRLSIHLGTEALDVAPQGRSFAVRLTGARTLPADAVVLATGHPGPADPFAARLPDDAWRYLRDPWSRDAYGSIRSNDRVLLVGTGLTAVDAVLALDESGHRGPVDALSRHGRLPHTHGVRGEALPADLGTELLAGVAAGGLRSILATVRRVAAVAERRGVSWQAVIDALRPMVPRIWSTLGAGDRERFVRWLRPFWDVHRHRLPPVVANRLASLRAGGRLRIQAGRLRGARDGGDAIAVEYEPRGASTPVRERYDWVINCTGSSFAEETARPLERRLLERGHLLPDPLSLGYATNDVGMAIGTRGPLDGLYLLGPACRPRWWEHTAVPELRAQAGHVAGDLAARLPRRADVAADDMRGRTSRYGT